MSSSQDQFGAPLIAKSKEAIQYLDEATLQIVGWCGDPVASVEKSLEFDPSFTLGRVARGVFELLANTPAKDPKVQECIKLAKESITDTTTKREKLHVDAFEYWSKGHIRHAASIWEQILATHPTDLLALKFVNDTYFFLGDSNNIRDSIGRVHKIWKERYGNDKAFGYIEGMYAFGWEETNFYRQAESSGRLALEINPSDAWAAHAVAHVMEMEGRTKEGIQFMSSTLPDWEKCGGLACHNHWHRALYHIELEQYDKVLDIYDTRIRATKSTVPYDLIDASSLLFRCQLVQADVGDRWDELIEAWASHMEERVFTFNDLHILFAALGAGKMDLVDKLKDAMSNYSKIPDPSITQSFITGDVGLGLADAITNWSLKNYDNVVTKLLPIRHKIQSIGGSHAQRDIFNILLAQSALKSGNKDVARSIACERIMLKQSSPQNWKLYSQATNENSADKIYKELLHSFTN